MKRPSNYINTSAQARERATVIRRLKAYARYCNEANTLRELEIMRAEEKRIIERAKQLGLYGALKAVKIC